MSANAGTKGSGGLSDFDQLPPRLREALRQFPLNMDAGFALQMLKRGKTETELIHLLKARAGMLSEFNPENKEREL